MIQMRDTGTNQVKYIAFPIKLCILIIDSKLILIIDYHNVRRNNLTIVTQLSFVRSSNKKNFGRNNKYVEYDINKNSKLVYMQFHVQFCSHNYNNIIYLVTDIEDVG